MTDSAVISRKHKVVRYGDLLFEVVEVQKVRRGKRCYRRVVGCGVFQSRESAKEWIRYTF